MKRSFYILLPVLMLALLLGFDACTTETYDNGDLDGYWQLNSVDSIATPQQVTTDMVGQRIFWAVQGKLLQTKKIGFDSFFLRFNHDGDQLTVSEPHYAMGTSESSGTEGDPLVTAKEDSLLSPYGIHVLWVKTGDKDSTLTEQFRVVELNSSSMVLEGKVLRLHFVKF